jgi:hypothetical protein
VNSLPVDLIERRRTNWKWPLVGSDDEPLSPQAVQLLFAPLAFFALMMLLMASLFVVAG